MYEYTKGRLHRHALAIDIQKDDGDHTRLANMSESSTAYLPVYERQAANAKRLVKCWNEHDELKAKADCHDGLVAALEFYADEANSVLLVSGRRNILSDGGAIAKAALAEAKKDNRAVE